MNWFTIPQLETSWLVDGLIPSDGHTAIVGKPKAGKSTFIRNLIVGVIKGRTFLDRSIDISEGTGRVLYIHLDRKDQPWRVAKELRDLGINEAESSRLTFRTAQDVPDGFDKRLPWLQKEIATVKPHLVVIDLLWQFATAKNSNDYNAVLDAINQLQDKLTEAKYGGALVVALHSRKATNPNDVGDDMLGSTGQRGSFSTNIFLTRHRKENVYTVMSEQTQRDEVYGEIDERVITRNLDGTLALGRSLRDIATEEKQVRAEAELRRLLAYITEHPGCEMTAMINDLGMSKKTVLRLLAFAGKLVTSTGEGVKGDPLKYFIRDDGDPQTAAAQMMVTYGGIQ